MTIGSDVDKQGEQPVELCESHGIPKILYEGRSWCKLCEEERYAIIRILRYWLTVCQWGIVLAIPVLIPTATALLPETHSGPAFWHGLYPLTAFFTIWVSILFGHWTLCLLGWLKRKRTWMLTWYDPTHALRDFLVISLPFTLLTTCGLFGIIAVLPDYQQMGVDAPGWLVSRAPILVAATLLTLGVLDGLRLISRYAILPQGAGRFRYASVYVLWVCALFFIVQPLMKDLADSRPSPALFYLLGGLVAFFILLYVGLHVVMHTHRDQLAKVLSQNTGSIPVHLALVAPSGAGKTIFLLRAYQLMQERFVHPLIRIMPTEESRAFARDNLNDMANGIWPPGTQTVSHIPFSLHCGTQELVRFMWMDLPGETFTNPEIYPEERRRFEQFLPTCDAVAFLFDATALAVQMKNKTIPFLTVYQDISVALYNRLQQAVGHGAHAVPLAIIVTKQCRLETLVADLAQARALGTSNVRKIRKRATTLLQDLVVNIWQTWADHVHLPRPVTAIFWTSALVSKEKTNAIPPVSEWKDEYCVEPIFWLTAQSLRAKLGLLDLLSGSHAQIVETILQLEALAKK